MQIDWFTLIAQVINFLVLVWLLKRFLYGRIVRAMEEREAKIAARLEEAARQQSQAEQEAERYRLQSQDLQGQREQTLAQARDEAEARRQQLVEAARQEVEQMRAQWIEALQQQKQQFLLDFREQIGQRIFAIVRRVLKDLANAELQEHMAATFLERVQRMAPPERQAMLEAIRASQREVELRSAFPLSAEMRRRLTHGLRDHLDDGIEVRFEVEPALGCGLELHSHSHRLAWNLESYLEALEDGLFRGLDDKAMEHGPPQRDTLDAIRPRDQDAASRPE